MIVTFIIECFLIQDFSNIKWTKTLMDVSDRTVRNQPPKLFVYLFSRLALAASTKVCLHKNYKAAQSEKGCFKGL